MTNPKGEKMKKTIKLFVITLFLLSMSTIAFAQNAPIDFEPGGYGADWTWTVFENDTNPPVEIIANPDVSAPNTSATVAKFTALVTGQPWAGCETLHGSDIGTFNLDQTNCTIKIMVHKPVMSDVGIKLVKPDGWSMGEIKVANTVINEWEELTFDFSSQLSDGYDQIVIFPDFDLAGRTQDNICYFDNITFSEQIIPQGPTEPAPTPMHNPADVFSIYSDAYTDLANTNFDPNWGQATIVTVNYQVSGDNTLRYQSLNYQGTNLGSPDGGVPQDVSAYDYLHVDFWTANATALNFFVLDQTAGEVFYSLPITTEEWIGVEVPLSYFSNGGEDLTDIHQFKVDGGDGSSTEVWFDNWYFYKDSVQEPTEPAPTPTHDPADVFSIYSDAYTNLADTNFDPDWGQATVVTVDYQIGGNNTLVYEVLNYQGTNLGSEYGGVPQDVSAYDYLHIDFWTANATTLNFFVLDQSAGEVSYSIPITTGEWVALDIPLSYFSNGGEDLTDIHQFKVDGGDGSSTKVYWDNWYFYKEVGIDDPISPTSLLINNYPNPFGPNTTISFSITEPGHVELMIYDIKGRLVEKLVDENIIPNTYTHTWNAQDVPSGTYFYQLIVDEKVVNTKSMILVK